LTIFKVRSTKPVRLLDVEHLGGASRIIPAEMVPRVIVDLVEFIEKSASGMVQVVCLRYSDNLHNDQRAGLWLLGGNYHHYHYEDR
jgi:hypothetical protein